MSLRDVSSPKPLLAKKGGAAPVKPGALRAGPEGPSLRPVDSDAAASADLSPAGAASGGAAETPQRQSAEAAPAASLLPFNLLRKRYRPDGSLDFAEADLDIVPADLVAALEPEPEREPEAAAAKPKDQAELALRVEPKPAAGADPRAPATAKPEPDLKIPPPPDAEGDASPDAPVPAPAPNPEWRVGAETPAQPVRTGGSWLLPVGALAAAFAVLVVGWKIANPDFDLGFWPAPETLTAEEPASDAPPPMAVEPPPPIAAAPVTPPPAPPSRAAAVEPAPAPLGADLPAPTLSPSAEGPVESGTATAETAATDSTAAKMPPADTVREAPAAPAVETASQGAPEPAQAAAPLAAGALSAPVKPTVDVVRLETSGEAVIAGRAAPNSELIVLDNGEPIGSVKADAFGDWVFVPDVKLPSGDHEFGLVVKTIQESVNLPAPDKLPLPPAPDSIPAQKAPESAPAGPAEDASGPVPGAESSQAPETAPTAVDAVAPTAPVPLRKPEPEPAATPAAPADDQAAARETPAANTADFVVQLASVKTRAGAEQEWRKLKARFPEMLSGMVPALDEVKLVDYGTVIRVRTGAFDSQRDAADLCARFEAQRQACLVVKVSGGN